MSDQTFIDGVQEITIQGGIVRVDYFTYAAEEKDAAGKPSKQFSHRVLMSPESFLQTFSAMERIVEQLIDKGAIKRKETASGGSPNF